MTLELDEKTVLCTMNNRKTNCYISAIWLTFILIAATKRIIQRFPAPDAELNGDAFWTYLPNARKFLEDPWKFLSTDPASFFVAPLGYIWPALWGAHPPLIQLANSFLFIASVLMMWRLTVRLSGLWAGFLATTLLVYYPEMVDYVPQVLTESIYLFGFLLFLMAANEYLLSDKKRCLWLALSSFGLSITLASRPVLQLFTIAAFLLTVFGTLLFYRKTKKSTLTANLFNPAVCLAIFLAMTPAALTVIKNGVYFKYWGIGTGAGSGLYYGVSPFKMGIEPVYTGFSYDAGIIPSTADPKTQGNPLTVRSDEILKKTAISIIKNTSLEDNIKFFIFKIKTWLFYSTEELRIQPKFRLLRTFEWLSILAGTLLIFRHSFTQTNKSGQTSYAYLPNKDGKDGARAAMLAFIFLLITGMILQFAPVLYNMRYNLYFLEPLTIILSSVSIGMLLHRGQQEKNSGIGIRIVKTLIWAAPRVLTIAVLAYLTYVLHQHFLRHRTWTMDPLRPGPTEIALDHRNIGAPRPINAEIHNQNSWTITQRPGILQIPISFSTPFSDDAFTDWLWRFKISLLPPHFDRNCRNIQINLEHPSPTRTVYDPEPFIHASLDGSMKLYTLYGNGNLRPAASGNMKLTFDCPPGTIIHWGGAQLLHVVMPQAARALIEHGTPINPYRPDDIQLNNTAHYIK